MKHEINRAPMAVILASGIATGLKPLTDEGPPGLLSVGGSAILERMIRNCLSCGISQFVVVLGYRSDQVKQFIDKTFRGIRVTYVMNDRYRDTGTGFALMLAGAVIGNAEFVTFDADVLFDTKILRGLVDSDLENVLCIDRKDAPDKDAVQVVVDEDGRIIDLGTSVDPKAAIGQSIGIGKISGDTGPLLFKELKQMMDNPQHYQATCHLAYAALIAGGRAFRGLDVTGMNWIKVDTGERFAAANAMFASPITTVSRGQQRALDEATAKANVPHG
jgi:choline kinase